jgi:hypothetical protein
MTGDDEERQYCLLIRYCEKINELEKRNGDSDGPK